MTLSLQGQTALVTAGTRGIGGAIATRLAEAGANIAVTFAGNQTAADEKVAELKALGVNAVAFKSDASDPSAAKRLVGEVVEALGRLDILVNNSGSFQLAVLGSDEAETAFDASFDWNVKTPFILANEAAKVLPTGGRIINIGSINADVSLIPGASIYSMTKGALQALTRGWARDLADRQITVNVIQPGPIDTEMNPADSEFAAFIGGRTAFGRYGTAREVANLAAWLASPEASYVTGAAIDIDGGLKT
ncbi:MAG: SDR family oxidoreductase [Pseudomonadota bacterium]